MWFTLTCSEGVEEEKELPDSGANVEGVEGLLQSVQLRQSGDQLQDVVLQILFHKNDGFLRIISAH